MLEELRVENLLLLERAELRLVQGLNVITGETGAGKTMLAQALDLLLGGRARAGIVRPGEAEAYVEGVFSAPPRLPDGELQERLPAGVQELVLARRVWPDGRTRAYICGRSATVGELRELGRRLLAFYGQHEHRKLTIAAAQLELLDAHCGPEHGALRRTVAAAHGRLRALERRVGELRQVTGARERELDLLAFELAEIEELCPSDEDEQALEAERSRLRASEQLRAAAGAAMEAVVGEGGGALELLAGPLRQLEAAASHDAELSPLSERFAGLLYELEDLSGAFRRYTLELDSSPARLEEVEERLDRYARLKRKHGSSLADVLAHADRCRERITELEQADRSLEEGQAERAEAAAELERLAAELSARRRAVASKLAAAVRGHLEQLAMAGVHFSVEVAARGDAIGPDGGDAVEFLISTNPGVPAAPVREIASGGELSRVMLALLSAAHSPGSAAEEPRALVFDEIDAGIGGHTARAVGEHLQALSRDMQLLCITHLPQIASLAERHFRIDKRTTRGSTVATVSELAGDAVVSELVRMLGASQHDKAASEHARQLLRAA